MNKISKITKYVADIFDLYDANKLGFFFDYDEDTFEKYVLPLFPHNKIDEDTLAKIVIHLGLTKQEILNMDEDAAKKYWNKYPFFKLYEEFMDCWTWHSRFKSNKPTAEEILMNALFTDNNGFPVEERYDYKSVKGRMLEKLKEIDSVIPGTFHEYAEITNLAISTEVFFSFPKCPDMLKAFIDMVERAELLFFKAVNSDLLEDEINELNFLASWLRITDIVMPNCVLTYDKIRIYREVYKEESLNDFFEYVKVRNFIDTSPWRCYEFFDDMELVQKFVNIFPHAKAMMREFSMDVNNFFCDFVWSDAGPVMLPPEEEEELDMFGENIPLEERARQRTFIYVKKTSEEMFDWEVFANKIKSAASSVSLGGLNVPSRGMDSDESMIRVKNRVNAKHGGNL